MDHIRKYLKVTRGITAHGHSELNYLGSVWGVRENDQADHFTVCSDCHYRDHFTVCNDYLYKDLHTARYWK